MKNFFNTKTVRERVLMTAFILFAVAWWGSSLLGRTRTFRTDWQTTASDGQDQLNWFNEKSRVAERTAKATAQLDPSRTLNAAQAFAEINRMGQGLSLEMGAQRTERTENFAMHSLQVTIRRAGLDSLLKFYQELGKRRPYLGIDQCSISTERASPGQINAVFRIYSVEVLRPGMP